MCTCREQQNPQVSSLQLLHYQAPQAALLVTLLSPMFDDTGALLLWLAKCNTSMRAVVIGEGDAEAGKPQPAVPESTILLVAMTVLFSCALAFFVNLSLFLVIGRTSPVSYQVSSLELSQPGYVLHRMWQRALPIRHVCPQSLLDRYFHWSTRVMVVMGPPS